MGRPRVNCLYPGCRHKKRARSLCGAHYSAASRFVTIGQTSWKKLSRDGKATEPRAQKPKVLYGWFIEE